MINFKLGKQSGFFLLEKNKTKQNNYLPLEIIMKSCICKVCYL